MVEETGETTDLLQVTDKLLSHNVHLTSMEFELTFVVIGTDCIGNCKSNYHTITTTTVPVIVSLIRSNKYIIFIIIYGWID